MKRLRSFLMFFAGIGLMLCVGWLALPLALYKSVDQPVQFSHRLHTGESVGLTCENCHSFREDGSFTGTPSLEQCANCHATQLGSSDEEKKLVDLYVTPQREIPWLVYARQPDNVFFSHIHHVNGAGLACDRCHGPHGTTDHLRPLQVNRISGYSRDIWGASLAGFHTESWEGMKMDDCIRCHDRNGRTDSCIDCHK
jgi:hypothetical protein